MQHIAVAEPAEVVRRLQHDIVPVSAIARAPGHDGAAKLLRSVSRFVYPKAVLEVVTHRCDAFFVGRHVLLLTAADLNGNGRVCRRFDVHAVNS